MAGDGFQLYNARKKAVRMGCALISQQGLNQSPHDWMDYLMYEGDESYDEIACYFKPCFLEMQQIAKDGFLTDPETGEKIYVEFVVGGDKPWHLALTGHRNMNFSFPSNSCKCNQKACNDFTRTLADHDKDAIDALTACMLTHVCPKHHFYGADGSEAFDCPAGSACIWGVDGGSHVTTTSNESLQERLEGMTPAHRTKELHAFATAHWGFDFMHPPLVFYSLIAPDPLHAYLNIVSKVFTVAVWEELLYDKKTAAAETMAVKDAALETINELSRPVGIQFVPDKMTKNNRNSVKHMFGTEGYLSGIVRAMSVVFNLALPTAAPPPVAVPVPGKKPPPKRAKGLQATAERGAGALARRLAAAAQSEEPPAETAEEPSPVETPAPAASASAEDQQAEMLRLVEGKKEIRLMMIFEAMLDHWSYVTDKSYDTGDAAVLATRKAEVHRLGRVLAEAALNLLGEDTQSTYLHDIVYGFPNVLERVGHLLRVAMEGFEHGNKVTKAVFKRECSRGGRKRKSDGGRRHEYTQAIEHRREGTVAATELGLVNKAAKARELCKPDSFYTRFYDVASAKVELAAIKKEAEDQQSQMLEQMERGI